MIGVRTPVLPKANEPCFCGSGKKFKRCHRAAYEPIRPAPQSPHRKVPDTIDAPFYAGVGGRSRDGDAVVKSPEVIARMRRTGRAAAEILAEAGEIIAPGVTTDEIDAFVHDACLARGGYPSPLDYGEPPYPKSLCASVNEVICHGIPDRRALVDGDIVNLDVTLYREGVHGDTNATWLVGRVDDASRRLVQVTRECLERGIEAVRPGRPLSDIGRAIQTHAEDHAMAVVRAFIGHGVGEEFHGDLQVLHYYEPRNSTVMEPGMTFTIEPMISLGAGEHRVWDDGWTAVTADRSRTAQFEHTLLVTDDGADILTLRPDGRWSGAA
ncbi:type I methionyl aminopeptidase [soil metagenome]